MLDPKVAFLNHGSFGRDASLTNRRGGGGGSRPSRSKSCSAARGAWSRRGESASASGLGNEAGRLRPRHQRHRRDQRRPAIDHPPDPEERTAHHHTRLPCRPPGDETFRRVQGASYREIEMPLPVHSPEQIADWCSRALFRTRLLAMDHVTSPTALVFPVERITAGCAGGAWRCWLTRHRAGRCPLKSATAEPLLCGEPSQMGLRIAGQRLSLGRLTVRNRHSSSGCEPLSGKGVVRVRVAGHARHRRRGGDPRGTELHGRAWMGRGHVAQPRDGRLV